MNDTKDPKPLLWLSMDERERAIWTSVFSTSVHYQSCGVAIEKANTVVRRFRIYAESDLNVPMVTRSRESGLSHCQQATHKGAATYEIEGSHEGNVITEIRFNGFTFLFTPPDK